MKMIKKRDNFMNILSNFVDEKKQARRERGKKDMQITIS